MLALGLVPEVEACLNDKNRKVILTEEEEHKTDKARFRWRCAQGGHKCFGAALCPCGLLSHLRVSLWLPFLFFANGMMLNYRWSKLAVDLSELLGISSHDTLNRWWSLCQSCLQICLEKTGGSGGLVIGQSSGDVVVFDETNMGSQRGIRKASSSERSTSNFEVCLLHEACVLLL